MKFSETDLSGAYIIALEAHEDQRGYFARAFCEREFSEHGLVSRFVQCNMSGNPKRGTLRGMHYQLPPHEEVKLIRCIQGAIWDCIVDLRPDSSTFRRWQGFELSADNREMLYVPTGFAHSYLTLTDDSAVFYMVSAFYAPGSERGIRYNDPAFDIEWPIPVEIISEKDAEHADWSE
ncbi:MAG: dTDP-4-dehydrorhamnose 3,5-epimerase [bacterium]